MLRDSPSDGWSACVSRKRASPGPSSRKAGNGVDVDRVLASFDFGLPEAGNDGWFISAQRPDADGATNGFDELITALGGPVIVVRVLRDDWAYLIASGPDSEPIAMVMTPNACATRSGRWVSGTGTTDPRSD